MQPARQLAVDETVVSANLEAPVGRAAALLSQGLGYGDVTALVGVGAAGGDLSVGGRVYLGPLVNAGGWIGFAFAPGHMSPVFHARVSTSVAPGRPIYGGAFVHSGAAPAGQLAGPFAGVELQLAEGVSLQAELRYGLASLEDGLGAAGQDGGSSSAMHDGFGLPCLESADVHPGACLQLGVGLHWTLGD